MSIITIIYLAIALLVFVSTLYNMIFKEERLVDQINAAMILIPLLLRIFLILLLGWAVLLLFYYSVRDRR